MAKIVIHNQSLNKKQQASTVSEYSIAMDVRIEAEQIRHIYSQTPFYVPMVLLGSLLTVIMLWPATTLVTGFIWCLVIWGIYIGLWVLSRRWKQVQPVDELMHVWARPYIVMSWLATAAWGSIGILFFHGESFVYQSLLFIVIVIGSAAITATSTAYSPTFYPVVLMVLPLFVSLLNEDKAIYQILAFGITLFTVMLFLLHRNSHGFYASSLKQRFMNEALAAELAVQKDIAEQASISKSKFLAAASHDLRQPLQALNLFLCELRERAGDENKQQQLMENMHKSIHGMNKLFNGVLDVSRYEAGVVDVNLVTFCVEDIFDSFREEYVIRAHTKGLYFDCKVCDDYIVSDPLLLKRILRNLLENALRYTPSGGVVLDCVHKESVISIQVADTGVGIVTENLMRIFEEFQQLDNASNENIKGIGLGLTVVKQLACALGHELSVESIPAKGSIFSLDVPLQNIEQCQSEINDRVAVIEDSLHNAQVLLLDDEKNSDNLKALLKSWGCHVRLAESFDAALSDRHAGRAVPDIIVSNIYQLNADTDVDKVNQLCGDGDTNTAFIMWVDDKADSCGSLKENTAIKFIKRPVESVRLATLMRFLLS